MEKENRKKVWTRIIFIPVAGLILLGMCFMLYYGIYMFIESNFYSTNMGGMPAEAIRLSLAAVLILLYIIILRTKAPELVKAISLIPPLSLLVIAVTMGFYQSPLRMIIGIVVITGLCTLWIYKSKKPWIYYYAETVAVIAAIYYAWPE